MIIEKIKDLVYKEDAEVDWIVEGLISSGSWTYLVGEAGAGKTMLMLQLVNALQTGQNFLNMKCKKRNCIYIQADTGMREWRNQTARVNPNSEVWTVYNTESNFLDNLSEVALIRRIVWGDYTEDHPFYEDLQGQRFDFIVFDVLNKITSVDLNVKSGMSHILTRIEKIVRKDKEEDIPYVLMHHPNASVKRGVNAGSGYKGFGGLCGNFLTLANSLLVLEKSKVSPRKEIYLDSTFWKQKGLWRLEGEDTEESIDELDNFFKNGTGNV